MIKCTTDKKKNETHCEMDGYLPEILEELYGAVKSVTEEIAKATVEKKDEESLKEEKEDTLLNFIISLLDINDLSLGDLVNYAISDAFNEGALCMLDEDNDEDNEIESGSFHILQ